MTTLEITNENQHLLRSEYQARTEKELPVLVRWFPVRLPLCFEALSHR